MRTYYDDNFGEIEILDEEDMEFYRNLQAESVWKICTGCGRKVKIKQEYALCNTCADILEHGGDLSYPVLKESGHKEDNEDNNDV